MRLVLLSEIVDEMAWSLWSGIYTEDTLLPTNESMVRDHAQ